MKKIHFAIVLFAGLLSSTASIAESKAIYFGYGMGGITAVNNTGMSDNTSSDSSLFDSHNYKVFIGVKDKYLGAELSYADLGEITFDSGAIAKPVSYNVALMGYLPVGDSEKFNLFAKAGWSFWENELETGSGSDTDNGNDPLVGVGLQWNFGIPEGAKLGVRAEYERHFDVSYENYYWSDMDMVSLSIVLSTQ